MGLLRQKSKEKAAKRAKAAAEAKENGDTDSKSKKGSSHRSSLLASIAALNNPAPDEFDPDKGDSFGAEVHLARADGDAFAYDDKEAASLAERSTLRRELGPEDFVEDPKYAGVTSSRRDISKGRKGRRTPHKSKGASGSSNSSRSSDGGDDEDSDSSSAVDLDAPSDSSDSQDSSSSSSSSNVGVDTMDIEDDDLQAELEEIKAGEKAAVMHLKASAQAEREQAKHVVRQRGLWEKFLHLRILLQKAVVLANRLPQTASAHDTFLEHGDKDVVTGVEHASELLSDLLSQQVQLQYELLHRAGPSVPAELKQAQAPKLDASKRIKKSRKRGRKELDRTLDDIYTSITVLDQPLRSHRNDIINKWNSKTQLVGGVVSKKFKALNQTIVSQIDHVLQDQPRLIKRTQLVRSSGKPVGVELTPEGNAAVREEEENKDKKQDKESYVHMQQEQYNPHVFDDADFYQQLLRELIESGAGAEDTGTDPIALSRRALAAKKLQAKQRRTLDRRATKGRRIKYTVHDKLVNFMAPSTAVAVQSAVGGEDLPGVLFPRLFGQASDAYDTQ